MDTLKLIGDLHIDKPFPYTNSKTAARWEEYRRNHYAKLFSGDSKIIQLGDVFDKPSVNCEKFVQALKLVEKCQKVLAGNHDLSKNTDKPSALLMLNYITENVAGKVTYLEPGVTLVPHQLTQGDFDVILKVLTPVDPGVLCLHCNFGEPKGNDTENYLRPSVAKELLSNGFTHIYCGHEHAYSEPMEGVTFVGAVLPVNFGEMEDKFIIEGGEKVLVWEASKHYAKLTAQEFMDSWMSDGLMFVEVVGELMASEALALNNRIAEWYLQSNSLIAIKNNTTQFHQQKVAENTPDDGTSYWVNDVTNLMTESQQVLFQDLLNRSEGDI